MADEKGVPKSFSSAPPAPPPKDKASYSRLEHVDDDDESDLDFRDDLLEDGRAKDGTREPMMLEDPADEDAKSSDNPRPLWMRSGAQESRARRWFRLRIIIPVLILLVLLAGGATTAADPEAARTVAEKVLPGVFAKPPTRYAFATYISGYNWSEVAPLYTGANDQFFDSARVMNYQLKHAPATKSRPDIDFITLVSKNVSQSARDMLSREGARVVISESLTPKWVADWYGDGRWGTVMDKFTLANMTDYEKICFLDADMVINQRLDGVFDDPATNIVPNRGNPDRVNQDDAPEPPEYMFAAVRDRSADDESNSENFGYLNAGFFCWHPSPEVFGYYMRFLHRENSFFPIYPEQNMLNLIHQQNGNLPFSRLNWIWNAHRPDFLDLMRGVHSFHAKGWLPNDVVETAYPELYRMWWYQKREMEAYYADMGLYPHTSEDGTGKDKLRPELIPEPPAGFIITPPNGTIDGEDAIFIEVPDDEVEAEIEADILEEVEHEVESEIEDDIKQDFDGEHKEEIEQAIEDEIEEKIEEELAGQSHAQDSQDDMTATEDDAIHVHDMDNTDGVGGTGDMMTEETNEEMDKPMDDNDELQGETDEAGPIHAKRAFAAGFRRSFLMPLPDGTIERVVVGGQNMY